MRDILSLVQRTLEPLPVRGKGRLAEQILRRTKADVLSCHPLSRMKVQLRFEGNELHALRGALHTIERNHPVIIAELNAHCLARGGVTPVDVVRFLRDQGYLVRRLDSENIWARCSF